MKRNSSVNAKQAATSSGFRFPGFTFAIMAILQALVLLPATATAQVIDWTNPNNLASWYDVAGNWVGGPPPGAAQTAQFNLNNTYEVWWNGNTAGNTPSVGFLSVLDGDVTFQNQDASPQYEFTVNGSGGSGAFTDFSISGAGTTLTNRGLYLHSLGGAQIINGATLTIDGSHSAGCRLGIDGSIGFQVDAYLNIQEGGIVNDRYAFIGNDVASTGVATVTGAGSQWNNSERIYVGNYGAGTLNVEAGGVVSSSREGLVGYNAGSTGLATVTGLGSQWNNSNWLAVGYSGIGTLNVEAGGVVSDVLAGYIGGLTGSTGNATVTGAGSQWNSSGAMYVGLNGNGTLNIESGGNVGSLNCFIGNLSGSTGLATVTGTGSQWNNAGDLWVGYAGAGTLNVEAGGVITDIDGYLGYATYPAGPYVGTGLATVTGVGSTWNNSGKLHVGRGGIGTLSVESGGIVASGTGYIGTLAGSNGDVIVAGAGSQWNNSGDLSVGGSDTATGGNGSLSIMDSGSVYVGGMTRLWANGSLTLDSGGSLDTFELDLTLGSFNMLAGTLHATNIFGDLYNQSGVLAPGHSPGILTIDGDYTQGAEATLQIELGGLNAGEFDALVINGNATLDGFLDISLYGGFALAQNQQFLIADVNGGLIGQYKDLGEGALVGTYGGTNLFITYNGFEGNAGVGLYTAVPEPGSAMVFGLIGLAGLISYRFRRH